MFCINLLRDAPCMRHSVTFNEISCTDTYQNSTLKLLMWFQFYPPPPNPLRGFVHEACGWTERYIPMFVHVVQRAHKDERISTFSC